MTTEDTTLPDDPDEPGPPGPVGFALALATYVVLGVTLKSVVLNWIVGPAYLVVVLHVIPTSLRRLRRRWSETGAQPTA